MIILKFIMKSTLLIIAICCLSIENRTDYEDTKNLICSLLGMGASAICIQAVDLL